MCSKPAYGVERLVVSELKHLRKSDFEFKYPTVATGTSDGTDGPASEDMQWRKCKGCLWRLHARRQTLTCSAQGLQTLTPSELTAGTPSPQPYARVRAEEQPTEAAHPARALLRSTTRAATPLTSQDGGFFIVQALLSIEDEHLHNGHPLVQTVEDFCGRVAGQFYCHGPSSTTVH